MFNKITQSLSLFFRVVPSLLCLLVTFGTIAVGATAHAITQGATIATGNNLGKDKAATDHMSMTEMVKQVTQQSAVKHRIETLADGRARIPSPLQTIDAFAASEGITVVSTNKDKPGNFAIRATSLGRTNVQSTLIKPGQVSVETDLVRIVHPEITEELTTSAEGVRQDFVISTAPQGSGDLTLELAFPGAALRSSGNIINLTMSGGRELVYHRLYVTDSSGKVLPSRFEMLGSNSLRIIVADAGAAYPVRIDPTITDNNWVSIARPDTNGSIFALASDGTNLYAGGDFTAIGGVVANKIAKWNGSVWSALGSGIGTYGNVAALTWDGTNLYAGGFFNTAGGVTAHNIAKWDGSDWSALGDGIYSSNNIHALAWDGANLYAGGNIAITPVDVQGVKVAKWDGSTWTALGSFTTTVYGFPSRINAFAMNGSSLYVGGQFDHVGNVVANNIAKWDGSAWSGVGGTNGAVNALLWNGSTLYAGGEFTTAGGVNADNVAKWNGSAWSALGSGMSGYGTVSTLAWYGSGLYAGGDFTTAGGVSANYIAKWDGSAWLGINGMTVGVGQLMTVGSNLYVEGYFTAVGGVSASKIAQWNGNAWSSLGSGIDNNINALLWDGTNLYVGGLFSTAEGAIANNIAKWNGSTWSALGSGLDGQVYALASDGTNLYAGGTFHTAGGVNANYIAKWNGSAWSALGSGMNSSVKTLAWGGTNLYAGGGFTNAGGVSTFSIAKWNGSEWSSLSGGLAGDVDALAWDGSNLYAAGYFAFYFGPELTPANGIAKWNGNNWSSMGDGLSSIRALAWDGASLYAARGSVFKWNGSAWLALSGVSSAYALASDGSNLYAAGAFTTAGGVSANRIAKWNGSAWSALGSGMSGTVNSLAFDGSNLYAAGDFLAAGGNAARVAYFNKNIPTVNFLSRGGSVIDSQSLALNTTISMPTAPTKSGTDFVGWYADAGLTLPFNFDTPITSDTWIYARWSLEPPTSTTGSVSDITTTSATLAGTVTSNLSATTVTFQYGTTTGYGSSTTAAQSPLAPSTTGSAVSAAITGLTCGSTYHYRVVAANSDGTVNGGDGIFTTSVCPDTTPPSVPTNIETQIPTVAGQLITTWTKPSDSDFAHIHIYRSTTAGTLGTLIADNLTGIKYTDTGLASQTKYYYTARSVDNAGNESTNTAQVFGTTLDTTPPAWVTGLTATNPGTGGTIDLTWNASSAPDFAHYRMYRSLNGTTYTQIRAQITGTSISDTGLTNGTIYYYSITAIDTVGNESEHSSLYAAVSATPAAVDMIPPAVVVCTTSLSQPVPKTGDTVLHNWTNPVDIDFAALRIYASSVSGELGSKVFEGNATTDTYTHSGLTPGSTYYYTYRSVDTFGNETINTSQCSIAMVDEVAPLCPTGLTGTVANNTIELNWNRSGSSDVSNYLLYGDSGDGTIDYVTPLATRSQGAQTSFSWTSPTLTPEAPYLFTLQAEDSVVPANVASSCGIVNVVVPPVSSACNTSARINYPQTGNVIGGNSVNVMAEVPGGSEGDVQGILLQYRLSGSSDWSALPVPVRDTSNSWYSLWDTSSLNAQYDLRAVVTCNSGNTDPAAGYITVTVDQTNPDLIVTSDMITSNLYQIAPSITVKRDLDTGGTTSLALPAGALDDNTTVNIADVPIPPALPSGYKEAGTYRNITFANSQHTLSNGQEAILEVSYLDDNNDGIVDGTTTLAVELQLCDYDGSTWSCFDSIVDTVNKKVKAKVSQFSIYGLLVPTKPFGSGWSMLAVPLSPTNPAPSTVFSGASQITSYDPTTGTYPIPGSIQAGRAYWVRNGSAGNLNVIGTETPNSTVNVPVKKGWNLIGNPFRYKVAIADLKVNSVDLATAEINGDALATFYHYKSGVFETTSLQDNGAIEAWKGYWFLSDVDGTLEIPAIPLQ